LIEGDRGAQIRLEKQEWNEKNKKRKPSNGQFS
jgi:hypothetical protein